jgi:patatin-like phospholipase/acyl hydrolase
MSDIKTETYACPRDRHLFGPGPKHILALDGGGVRGAVSVAFLERLEEILEQEAGHPVRLGDWFDLIGGTSTGAVIAGALALGYRASEVKDFYLRLAPKAFKARWSIPYLQAKFDARGLRSEIDKIVANRTLESTDLITGLAIISKRIDTGSPWIVANNSRNKFWQKGDRHLANKDYPLATLVRASTAAPLYFDPQIIPIVADPPVDPLGEVAAPFSGAPWQAFFMTKLRALYGLISKKGPSADTHGLFVDGGVTPYNNPSMALLMLVALKQHKLCWELGPKNLTIVSIGTGSFRTKISFAELGLAGPVKLAKQAMLSSIGDAQNLAVAMMQWLGECPIRQVINSEIEALADNTPPGGPWFRFMRYDLDLRDTVELQAMDNLAVIEPLYDMARRTAAKQMQREHFFGAPVGP